MTRLRCALIGADTLLIECARMLIDRGHDIVSVAAGSPRVEKWAAHAEIPVCDAESVEVWANELREQAVDYIFAITHLHLLPPSIAASAKRMAINFHDGPLPDYAGLNTPVWGILGNETEWGVSWHRIDQGVDTGDVLVERRFAIANRETALSLNTRNFEEALESFRDVIELLEADRITTEPQDLRRPRHVYRRADRPDGVLDFTRSAVEVDRLVRALHFGPHPNSVAAAVLWHPIAAVVVGSSEIVETSEWSAAGTILAADDHGLIVACSANAIRLGNLHWLDGSDCSATEFLKVTMSEVGGALAQLNGDQRQWLADRASRNQREETTTTEALSALLPATFPWLHAVAQAEREQHATVRVPFDGPCTPTLIVSALAVMLARLATDGGFDVAIAQQSVPDFARPLIFTEAALDLKIDLTWSADQILSTVGEKLAARRAASLRRDLVARSPHLAGRAELAGGLNIPIGIRLSVDDSRLPRSSVVLQPSAAEGCWDIEYDSAAIAEVGATEFARCLGLVAKAFGGGVSPTQVPWLSGAPLERVVYRWNDTGQSNDTQAAGHAACIHDLIARQAAAAPDRQAIICGDQSLTYDELLRRAHRLASQLRDVGVGPDSLVGVHVDRSIELVVAVLGVLLSGGAYVPLDPAYPADRLRHMIADSGTRVIVCNERHRERLPLPGDDAERVVISVDTSPINDTGPFNGTGPFNDTGPHNLAYCIYTSGSAGTPKGVLVEHRNVANLFVAMDAVIERGENDTWCAVTSLSFDISVLELLYTLARGIRIALYVPDVHQLAAPRKPMDFSLFYFSADEAAGTHAKYRLLLEGARFADDNDFCAVWTPERHFHAFGGLYPNPAVTAAAIAMVTERVAIRAGSVVLPLHHPIEVVEAWSMVDNLSNGRVGVAFASGWQPNDFVLRPQNYARAKDALYEGVEQIQRLWRGETLSFDGPDRQPVAVTTLPRPVQAELPIWITTAGSRDSFITAGRAGANLLTHLVGQSIEQLAAKISDYRAARAAAGHDPATGVITLMLHTFVGDDEQIVRAAVHEPLRAYLRSSFNLLREHAWSFPTFRKPDGAAVSNANDLADADIAKLAGADLDAVLDFAAERYYDTSGLFGTPEQVASRVERFHQVGVDEIACLIDFGVETDAVLASLPHLARARVLVATQDAPHVSAENSTSIAEVIVSSATTHLQCTPSMARMLTDDVAARTALGTVQHLLVGGEALPADLASELHSLVASKAGGTVTNMYGPTETTVWSSTWRLQADWDWTPIGSPIANTQLYVLDVVGHPTPPGVAGQLWIGGEGVARGYHNRPDLSAERFLPDPFRDTGRMYCTGDLARWRMQSDGGATLEFLGRSDQQVKLRGHRIELGEIERELRRVADIVDCAAVVQSHAQEQQLVAYVVTNATAFDARAVRDLLRTRLPEVMVPSQIVPLSALPRTPNGKLDRRALPSSVAAPSVEHSAPTSDTEHRVLRDWHEILGTGEIGIDDNFFDAGGHSLLVVRLHRRLQVTLGHNIALTDLYRFPTVRTFTASLTHEHTSSAAIESGLDRAARRRATARSRS